MEIRRDFYLDKLIKRKNNGLIKVITGIRRCGKSYLLNNLFYHHLLEGGVDFVCNLGSSRYYIQSAYSLPDEEKRTQEIRPFRKIDDSFKKIVVTKDIVQPHYDEYGILTVNIYDFLLDPQILEK